MNVDIGNFIYTFRRRLYEQLEYSFDTTTGSMGVMVGGESQQFVEKILYFASKLAYTKEWVQALSQLEVSVDPKRYLFRVDWDKDMAVAVSLYARLPDNDSVTAQIALNKIAPFGWNGPCINCLSSVMNKTSPEGVAFRAGVNGENGTALYFRMNMPMSSFRLRIAPDLVKLSGLPNSVASEIAADMPLLYDTTNVGVIGLDSKPGGGIQHIKLDPSKVPVTMAIAFLREKGVKKNRINQLLSISRSMRMQQLSYIGLKYSRDGFKGGKYQSQLPVHILSIGVNQY